MNRGFSLLEVLIAAVVLGIATLSLLAALSGSMRLQEATSEEVAALNAIQLQIAQIHEDARPANGFTNMLQKYIADPYFTVEGLTTADGQPINGKVTVLLSEDLAGIDSGVTPPEWGLGSPPALDMNLNGTTTDTFDSGTLNSIQTAAIQVQVKWVAQNGESESSVTRHVLVTRR